jgi:hypothetical protein
MAKKFPYVHSAGPLVRTIEHLRKSFPKEVTADTLRKLGVAPKNETYVINVLRFLGTIDDEGKKVAAKSKAFLQHKDEAFQGEFAILVKEAYEELFELHGDASWELDRATLTQFFRTTDHSSDIVGKRQAGTFANLSGLSGHSTVPAAAKPAVKKTSEASEASKRAAKPKVTAKKAESEGKHTGTPVNRQVGLTVRVEVNLPAEGDQQTYDRIFRSIRKNLIDGE